MTFAPSIITFVLAYYINNLGISLSFPAIQTFLSNNSKPQNQGELFGIEESIGALTSIVAPIAASVLYAYTKGFIFVETALIPIITLAIFYLVLKKDCKNVKLVT